MSSNIGQTYGIIFVKVETVEQKEGSKNEQNYQDNYKISLNLQRCFRKNFHSYNIFHLIGMIIDIVVVHSICLGLDCYFVWEGRDVRSTVKQ